MGQRWPEYTAYSMRKEGGMSDEIGTLDQVRRDVAQGWDYETDAVMIVGFPSHKVPGFIIFSRDRGLYVWAKPNGNGYNFNPRTGRLTSAHPLPDKTKRKMAEAMREYGYTASTATPRKKAPAKRKTAKKTACRRA